MKLAMARPSRCFATLLMPSAANYARTTAYELDGSTAVQRFSIQGSSYHMVELTP